VRPRRRLPRRPGTVVLVRQLRARRRNRLHHRLRRPSIRRAVDDGHLALGDGTDLPGHQRNPSRTQSAGHQPPRAVVREVVSLLLIPEDD
jgi:hypothetical protein